MAETVWISLGSNLGPGRRLFQEVFTELTHWPGLKIEQASSLYRTPPWGDTAQSAFLNAVLGGECDLEPEELLAQLLALESRLGRRRGDRRWGPRRIDLDLLLHGNREFKSKNLELPHPRLHERAFVLLPLVELAPDTQIPGRGSARSCLAAVSTEGIEALSRTWSTQ